MSWMPKQRNIIDFTISSLIRRKGKVAALAAVYTLVVFVLASVMFFTHAIKREAAFILRDAPEIVVQRLIAGRHDLVPLGYAEKIKEIPGVQEVRGRLWGYYFDPIYGANYTLLVPPEFEYGPGEIVVGNGLTRSSYAFEDNILPLRTYKGALKGFKIRRTLAAESELVTADSILMGEEDFRNLFGIPKGYATDLTLRVRNPKELATIANKIYEIFPDSRPIIRDEILRTYESVFNWRGGIMILLLSGGVLAFAIFAWDKATGLSAEEKREIGILKGLGWETTDVLLMKFWEGTAVSLSSFLAGVILAYVHVFFTSSALFEPALKGWAVIYPQFRLTPFIDPFQVANLFFLTVIPYTAATIVPSWRAATIDPDAVMRG
ncbi:MAG: FtsX-like permease family protein [Geobacter sp.]|nr:MAG: FtsX-like permease family protein [Geobacter sp.]